MEEELESVSSAEYRVEIIAARGRLLLFLLLVKSSLAGLGFFDVAVHGGSQKVVFGRIEDLHLCLVEVEVKHSVAAFVGPTNAGHWSLYHRLGICFPESSFADISTVLRIVSVLNTISMGGWWGDVRDLVSLHCFSFSFLA